MLHTFECVLCLFLVQASHDHQKSYLVVLSVVYHHFSQFSTLLPSELHPTPEESMSGKQFEMLLYANYTLAVGLCSWFWYGCG